MYFKYLGSFKIKDAMIFSQWALNIINWIIFKSSIFRQFYETTNEQESYILSWYFAGFWWWWLCNSLRGNCYICPQHHCGHQIQSARQPKANWNHNRGNKGPFWYPWCGTCMHLPNRSPLCLGIKVPPPKNTPLRSFRRSFLSLKM